MVSANVRPAASPREDASEKSAADAVKVVTLAQLLDAEASEAAAPSPTMDAPADTEYGGPKGLEPTRYGDWEKGGRCIDF